MTANARLFAYYHREAHTNLFIATLEVFYASLILIFCSTARVDENHRRKLRFVIQTEQLNGKICF